MALTIVATAGATNANSYVTLADAESYMEGRLAVTNWDAATDDNKNRSLRMATDILDQKAWSGRKTSSSQRLEWPRFGTVDRDGWEYASGAIPRPVEEATYELALSLVDGTYAVAPDDLEKYDRVKLDVLEVVPRKDYQAAQLPDHVQDIVEHLLTAGVGDYTVPVVRS